MGLEVLMTYRTLGLWASLPAVRTHTHRLFALTGDDDDDEEDEDAAAFQAFEQAGLVMAQMAVALSAQVQWKSSLVTWRTLTLKRMRRMQRSVCVIPLLLLRPAPPRRAWSSTATGQQLYVMLALIWCACQVKVLAGAQPAPSGARDFLSAQSALPAGRRLLWWFFRLWTYKYDL